MFNLWIVLLSLTLEAKVLQGEISINKSGQYHVNLADDNTDAKIPIYTSTGISDYDIRKLNSGDFLIGKGIMQNAAAVFDTVDFVKLKNLVGVWENRTDGITMDIQSMTRMSLSTGKGSKKQTENFVYALAPNEKTKWTMFIFQSPSTPETKIIPAIVTYNNPNSARMLRLVVYDPDTVHVRLQTTLFLKK